MNNLEFKIVDDRIFSDQLKVYLFHKNNERISSATEIKFENFEIGNFISETFTIDTPTAQTLIDELWKCGLRPEGVQYTTETLQSLKNHISDLQKQVEFFKKLFSK